MATLARLIAVIEADTTAFERAAGVDPDTVAEYADVLREAAEFGRPWPFPPLEGVRDTGGDLHLYGGFTRLAAAKAAGWEAAPVRSLRGDDRDALRLALGENATHGQRRTNADKRKAVETALLDREWGGKSDREVAGLCAVSRSMVLRTRQEMEGDGRLVAQLQVTGTDGRTINTANIGSTPKPKPKPTAPPAAEAKPEPPYAPFKATATKPTQAPAKPAASPQRAAQGETDAAPLTPGYDDGQFSDDAEADELPPDERFGGEPAPWETDAPMLTPAEWKDRLLAKPPPSGCRASGVGLPCGHERRRPCLARQRLPDEARGSSVLRSAVDGPENRPEADPFDGREGAAGGRTVGG